MSVLARRRCCAVLVAVVVAGTGPVVALGQAKPATVKDRTGDARQGVDMVRASLVATEDRALRVTITLAQPFDPVDLEAEERPPGAICVAVWTRRDASADPADFLVCARTVEGRLVASVLRERSNGLPRRVASATVTQPSPRVVTVRFARAAIGDPGGLRFVAVTQVHGAGCRPPAGCSDRVPDAPASARYLLGGDIPPG